jgi:DNA-binding NtrC family response regulator
MDHETTSSMTRRVLIVEDETKLRGMLLRAIREMEFETDGAGSGEAALGMLDKAPSDIVLVDLNLPGIDGLEFCEQVRRRWPTTQVIVLTGYGDLEAAKTAFRLDVVDFLTKPCPLHDLEVALDRALRRRRNQIVARAVDIVEPRQVQDAPAAAPGPAESPREESTLEAMERRHILEALARNDGNRGATAEELGISVRTLYYRLAAYERQGFYTRPG